VWIAGVDVPQELLTAHRRAELVLFVGAGASMAPPSSLPSFGQLAEALAKERFVKLDERDYDHLDGFLGRLQDQHGADVHNRVKAYIDRAESAPNRVHAGVAALALAGPPARIVTTNYDPHLTSALADAGAAVTEYVAPALPMGDDFDGLVYLHGRTEQPAHRLVVTDRDFGRAYLTDAWAARFLERMFRRFSVLFIGYSHSDPVMSYLARGLPRDGPPRYALASDPLEEKWRLLGIHPVEYRNEDDQHAAVHELLQRWAGDARRGLLDHRQRLAELTYAPPSGIPEEQSYLEDTLTDPARTTLFVEQARSPEWLMWLTTHPQFQALVNDGATSSNITRTLAYWIAEHFVASQDHSELALRVIAGAGGRLSATLWDAIGHWLHITGAPRPDWLDRWVPILVANAPRHENDWLSYALGASQWPSQRASVLLLLDHLTDPTVSLRLVFGGLGRPTLEVHLRDDHDDIRHAYEAGVQPHLADLADDVLVIAERHLRKAHAFTRSFGSATATWDPLSFHRSAIQPHPQDAPPQPIDVVIDAARDAMAELTRRHQWAAASALSRWTSSDLPLLRRLAVHGQGERNDMSADDKINWLIRKGVVHQVDVSQEVFHLLARTLLECSTNAVSALVDAVSAGQPADGGGGEDPQSRLIYDLLGWIARHAPTSETARQAFANIQRTHPYWGEQQHAGLGSWREVGFVRRQPPMPADQLATMLRENPTGALAQLLTYEGADSPWEGSTWHDAIAVLAEVVSADPALGYVVLDAAEGHSALAAAAVRGWAQAALEEAEAARVAGRLQAWVNDDTVPDLARLLSGAGSDPAGVEWQKIPEARALARRVWDSVTDAGAADDGTVTLSRAINHPSGHVAEFWVRAVTADWRAAGDEWQGLSPELREPLEAMLMRGGESTAMVEVLLASRVLLLYSADSDWTASHVLPLLSWEDPQRARRAWDGYLILGRANDQLLQAGLLEQYIDCAKHAATFTEGMQRQLAGHLAAIALFTSLDLRSWTRRLTATADLPLRVAWLSSITDALLDLDAVAAEAQWQRWLWTYWTDRLASVPLPLDPDEAGAIAGWALSLHESTEAALQLAAAAPARLTRHSDVLRRLTPERLARAPQGWSAVLAHLLHFSERPFHECHRLREIALALRELDAGIDLAPIIEQAIRLGCGAAAW